MNVALGKRDGRRKQVDTQLIEHGSDFGLHYYTSRAVDFFGKASKQVLV